MDKDALLDALNRAQESIRAADHKAGIVLTTIGVLLVFPMPALLAVGDEPNTGRVTLPVIVLASGALLAYVVTLVNCVLVLFPRTSNISHTFSLIYWGDVGSLDLNTYLDRVKAQTASAYFEDLACQVHVNAIIADRKHKHFKFAVWALSGGIAFLIACYGVFVWQ